MNFEMSVTWSGEEKPLARKDNSLKIPICDVSNADNLNLAGVVEVGAGEAIGVVLRHGVKDLRHGEEWGGVGTIIQNRNSPK